MVSALQIERVNNIPLLLASSNRTLLELWVVCTEIQANRYRAAGGKALDRVQVHCSGSAKTVERCDRIIATRTRYDSDVIVDKRGNVRGCSEGITSGRVLTCSNYGRTRIGIGRTSRLAVRWRIAESKKEVSSLAEVLIQSEARRVGRAWV